MKNGPKVVLYQDTSKHVAFASLYVMFGGDVKKAKIDGKEYKIPNGIAHFIEHLLIEHSKYGNFLLDMEKKILIVMALQIKIEQSFMLIL